MTKLSIINFIKNSPYFVRGELVLSSRIDEDLGIDGDDARELIGLIKREYELDDKGFIFEKYFEREGWNLFGIPKLISKLRGIPYIEKENYSLTVKDLDDWIKRGYWTDPK